MNITLLLLLLFLHYYPAHTTLETFSQIELHLQESVVNSMKMLSMVYIRINVIDEKEVTAYVTMPDCFLQGCSEDIVIFRADGGNHFTDYGIYEGMFLFFDRKKRFKKGRLSCYINTAGDDRPKYRVSDKNIDGYKHLGRLVLTLRNYEE